MGQLRTANKRHKRAIAARQPRKELAETAEKATSVPKDEA